MNKTFRTVIIASVGMMLVLLAWQLNLGGPGRSVDPRLPRDVTLPQLEGHPEGCLACHGGMEGFAPAHRPEKIGCSSCHGGDPTVLNATRAHTGMTRVPGNLQVIHQSCARSGCHEDMATRVERSLMTSMSGVISVDRWVFGEISSPDTPHHVKHLGHTPAETHLRQLCASCHLGNPKPSPGPVTEETRGGGCSACHLRYEPAALDSLRLKGDPFATGIRVHPDISLRLAGDACLGCHSRSGRISLGFEGWHEAGSGGVASAGEAPQEHRRLMDGRDLIRKQADIHHEKGMECIDCHGALEVMGDGQAHLHQEEARRSACADCHPAGEARTADPAGLDPETRTILRLRGEEDARARPVIGVRGQVYPKLRVENGELVLLGKGDGRRHVAKPMPANCGGRSSAHARLSCESCHASWAPHCTECHTRPESSQAGWDLLSDRETKGTWVETGGIQHADRPVLGLMRDSYDADDKPPRIGAFIPGMILHLTQAPGKQAVFKRLHAPTSPHTTRAESRRCEECHLDPLALGYGRGRLDFVVQGDQGHWKFTPEQVVLVQDGLPKDAWIAFLKQPAPGQSTRETAAPLGLEEQKRILLVGSCLSCHPASDSEFRRRLVDFDAALRARRPQCIEPSWGQR